ncbi:hypothetical protein ACTFIR_001975 [Dictyostelium discoideum]
MSAGRTGPGHCYRIYSSAVYNDHFEQFSKPEILMIPTDGMVLQMKSMGIQKITCFPFPTPPEEASLRLVLKTVLVNLGQTATTINACNSIDGTCFIHPTSNLSGSIEYVIYCDIIETSRPYMKLVAEINPSLLKIDHPDQMCEVFTPLKYLNTTPSIIVKMNTQSKVYQLVNTLKSKGISTKEKLLNQWLENYLFDQYLSWLNINTIKPSILI